MPRTIEADDLARLREAIDLLEATRLDRIDDDAERVATIAASIAAGAFDPRYNGWPNRETWNAALWIGNEEPLYRESRAVVRQAFDDYDEPTMLAEIRKDDPPEQRAADRRRAAVYDAGAALARWYAEVIDEPDTGPLADIVGYALARVDWTEIAEGIADDLELGDPLADEDDEDDEA